MVVEWLRVGFVHGVMNTDNMSILGLTIDYGPYGWLDDYDPNWTPNTTDAQHRRYRYGHQANIAQWNLVQLANALYPLVEEIEPLQDAIHHYADRFQAKWSQMMASKLGISSLNDSRDRSLADEALSVMQVVETDMTRFWRKLGGVDCSASLGAAERTEPLLGSIYERESATRPQISAFVDFAQRWAARHRELGTNDLERQMSMDAVNPKYVLRNYMAQLAIERAEQDDASMIEELLDLVRRPYDEQPERNQFASLRPEWARSKVGCSQLSCSS
jgi:uncharacterized protein YdiU (UPF0061 family)